MGAILLLAITQLVQQVSLLKMEILNIQLMKLRLQEILKICSKI